MQPILVVDELDGTSRIVPEVVSFMQALLGRGDSFSKMRGIANTLALLHDYMTIPLSSKPVTPEALPEVVAGFLRKRRQGTSGHDGLTWTPVKRETVERDRSYLRQFSEFCASRFGYFPLVPLRAACSFEEEGRSYRAVMRFLSKRNNMLLGHLAGKSPKPTQMAAIGIKEPVARRRSNGKTFMSPAMIEDLILATPSIIQRMVFIQAAFGGQRLSEILNMWRCDVLPGRYRPTLFPDDKASDIPLVVLAHPSQSRYIGETRPGSIDRLQHLALIYGLQPRNLMEDVDPLKSGWKGVLFDNDDLLISQVFWADRAWARMYYELFQQLREHVLPLVAESIRNSHPYLIINDSPSRDEFGQPMKISNIRKAFGRACARIGIDVSRLHKGIHGLRHSYKARLEHMGLTAEEIRTAMHHISISSQQNYGQSAARLNERLTLVTGNAGVTA
ncbi:tyrosine-type recombinase/integrase [Chromobacterium amazonense]|uniref:Tyrosine-type recombinase/integrase n=1 Tax=Chromobacterium amazonense TaxID=1382803 RepID=A0ABU8V4S2_9NEIS|nr:tyrosine-type recombinase/integrase [Chromobacterium amazonense]MDQ4540327.1 tyrosine-type recombinase/integrase [Chromobacterium amazonense]